MKRDISKKGRARQRPEFRVSNDYVRKHLFELLKLTDELRTAYVTYPRLGALVSEGTWETLTDVPYRQLLELNLQPRDRRLRDAFAKNHLALEDLLASMLVRDRSGLNDTLTRVLRYKIVNGLVTR